MTLVAHTNDNWNVVYRKSGAPVAVDAAPTNDGTATDPSTFEQYGSFISYPLKSLHEGAPPALWLLATGGTVTATIYVLVGTTWMPFKTAASITATDATVVNVPPHAKLFIRVTAAPAATLLVAGWGPPV